MYVKLLIIIVNQSTKDDNDYYATEPIVVSDTESDHMIIMDTHTIRGSLEDTLTHLTNPTDVVTTRMPVLKFSTNDRQIVDGPTFTMEIIIDSYVYYDNYVL